MTVTVCTDVVDRDACFVHVSSDIERVIYEYTRALSASVVPIARADDFDTLDNRAARCSFTRQIKRR